jgi:hypothetical protein
VLGDWLDDARSPATPARHQAATGVYYERDDEPTGAPLPAGVVGWAPTGVPAASPPARPHPPGSAWSYPPGYWGDPSYRLDDPHGRQA